MNPFQLMPINKYSFWGFILTVIGFFTIPIAIGFIFMPIGAAMMVFGFHKTIYDIGKGAYNIWNKIKTILK